MNKRHKILEYKTVMLYYGNENIDFKIIFGNLKFKSQEVFL